MYFLEIEGQFCNNFKEILGVIYIQGDAESLSLHIKHRYTSVRGAATLVASV